MCLNPPPPPPPNFSYNAPLWFSMHKCSQNAQPCPYKAHLVVSFHGGRFVPSCGNGERAVGVLCTGVGVLRTTFPKRLLCSKKCFPAYFIKNTEYRSTNFTGRRPTWLYPESADDLHLVISRPKMCWLHKVPILRGGRLRQVPLQLFRTHSHIYRPM